MQIRLIHNLARSGGTLVARCIGCMKGVAQLSEIHPHGMNVFNPLRQAHEWYALLTPDDQEYLSANKVSFVKALELIAERCEQRGLKLIVRDWSHLDFVGVPYTDTPSFRLTISDTLKDHFKIIETATVRHPLDTWLSLSRMAPMKNKINHEMYLHGYLKFARHAKRIGFVRHEDLVADPDRYLALLCDRLKIGFDPSYREKWNQYHKVTGDPYQQGRGGHSIQHVPRRSYAPELNDIFSASADYRTAIKLLGYKHPG